MRPHAPTAYDSKEQHVIAELHNAAAELLDSISALSAVQDQVAAAGRRICAAFDGVVLGTCWAPTGDTGNVSWPPTDRPGPWPFGCDHTLATVPSVDLACTCMAGHEQEHAGPSPDPAEGAVNHVRRLGELVRGHVAFHKRLAHVLESVADEVDDVRRAWRAKEE